MAEELEKTCKNCKYDDEDMEGTHCRHCIHNATEKFEPKEVELTEEEIRAKAIDEFANFLHEKAKENNGLRLSGETRSWTHPCIFDYLKEFKEIAEQMKGGGKNE